MNKVRRGSIAYERLSGAIEAAQLETSLDDAVWVRPDEPATIAAARLEDLHFDQAPAGVNREPEGYVLTRELRATLGRRHAAAVVHRLDRSVLVSGNASVRDVMAAFARDSPLLFVVARHTVTGFITPSDLNKHPARAHFYLLFADLEMAYATAVREQFPDQQAAVALLSDPKERKKIENRYRRDQRDDVAVDLVTGMDLAHLLEIIGQTTGLRARFGLADIDQWSSATADLPKTRDAVMHPVLSFLTRKRGVRELMALEDTVRQMLR